MIGVSSRLPRLVVVAILLLAAGIVGNAFELQGSEKSVYVILTDAQNKPAPPGAPANVFKIREDNIDRDVVKVEQIKEPMAIVLLADTTSAMVPFPRDLRDSAAAFTNRMLKNSPQSSVALWEFGGADIPVEQFTSDAPKLAEAATKLFPKGTLTDMDLVAAGTAVPRGQNITGSNLIEALVGASKALAKRPEKRKIIVSFNSDLSVESNGVQGPTAQSELEKANVTVIAVSMQAQAANGPLRDNVLDGVCPYSGGRRITIATIQALAATLENVADIISSQYIVTYSRPSGTPKQVFVGIQANGFKGSTPRWAPK
ncbi:MAG TPA: hypothetical protein VJN96_10465 [Vicinamibacterales bacterium]|nr:hypothetical protein [Vicinamibacterales bacterium]